MAGVKAGDGALGDAQGHCPISANLRSCSLRIVRDTTKCVSAAQQRVVRCRSQLTTADTVADTALCACRMQRLVAEGEGTASLLSSEPNSPTLITSKRNAN